MEFISRQIATRIAAFLLPLLPLAGCGDKGTDPAGNAPARAGAGSEYVYRRLQYDTDDPTRLISTTTDTFRILRTDLTVDGVGGLRSIWRSSLPRDTAYVRYEAGGDITIFTRATGISGAGSFLSITYPFGSRTRTMTDRDTSSSGSVISTDSLNYQGEVALALPAGKIAASKVALIMDHRTYNNKMEEVSCVREIETIYSAAKTGFIVRMTWEHEYLDPSGRLMQRKLLDDTELVAYSLK